MFKQAVTKRDCQMQPWLHGLQCCGLLCGRWMLSGNQHAGIFSIGEYRRWRVRENTKWEDHTQQTWRDGPELIIRSTRCCCMCLICLCCRAELCCSLQDNAVIPATPSSCVLESGLLVRTSEAGRLCACQGLYWAQGTAHVHKRLWRFRDWSKSRTSKAQLGADFQIIFNAMKEWDLNRWNILWRDINTVQSQRFLTLFVLHTVCCLLAEIIEHTCEKLLK